MLFEYSPESGLKPIGEGENHALEKSYLEENLEKMDHISQKFSAFRGDENFAEENEIAYAEITENEIILTYFGTVVNTEFDVVFARKNGGFALKSFGMLKNIPDDWENKKR